MDIEKAINDDYQALFYPEPMPVMTDAEPEALPMESPAGSQTVTPAEFGMDMGNLVKGVVTGAAGLTGDVLAIGRGLFEIGRRGGDETKLDAFLGGMEAGTFVPTTENINQWIDENVGLPERMKGASTTGFIGEVVAPGSAATKVVKAASKMAKGVPKVIKKVSSGAGAKDTKAINFNVSITDASDIFGAGAEKVIYRDPNSGGYIQVLTRPDQPASVLGLEVPEAFRKQGIGKKLQEEMLKDFPNMQGQVSSKTAARSAYKLGRRPAGQPDATLDDVLKMIDENSSVNLVSPARQQEILANALPLKTGSATMDKEQKAK